MYIYIVQSADVHVSAFHASSVQLGIYSTICRHACFCVPRLISAAWYTSTYVAASYLYT